MWLVSDKEPGIASLKVLGCELSHMQYNTSGFRSMGLMGEGALDVLMEPHGRKPCGREGSATICPTHSILFRMGASLRMSS